MRRKIVGVIAVSILILVAWRWWPRHTPVVHAAAPPPVERVHLPWVITPPPAVAQLAVKHKPDESRYGLWMLADPALPMLVADSLIVSRFPRDSLPLTKYQVDQLQPNRRFDTRG